MGVTPELQEILIRRMAEMPCFDFILETLLFGGPQAKVQRAAQKLIFSSVAFCESEVARAWSCEPACTACLQKLWNYCVNRLGSWFRTLRMYHNQVILWICVSADNSRLSDLGDLSSWMRTECNTGCYQDVVSVYRIFVTLMLHARRLDHYHSCYSFAMF